MYETDDDIARLQAVLDESYAVAGDHLKGIITSERRVAAADLAERLRGMCLLVLATVTADCRPLAGPVDGVFYRGAFYFGSSPDSVRMRHIARRPQVSATHLPAEEFAVTVHGRASPVQVSGADGGEDGGGFRRALLETYLPRYPDFETFLDGGPVYARIDAERMFTFRMG